MTFLPVHSDEHKRLVYVSIFLCFLFSLLIFRFYQIQIVEGELQLNFPSGSIAAGSKGLFKKSKSTPGKLEITITPHEPTEGLKQIVEAYEAILKRQIG